VADRAVGAANVAVRAAARPNRSHLPSSAVAAGSVAARQITVRQTTRIGRRTIGEADARARHDRGDERAAASGLRVTRAGKREKSRSIVHSSRTRWSRQTAAIRASWTFGPRPAAVPGAEGLRVEDRLERVPRPDLGLLRQADGSRLQLPRREGVREARRLPLAHRLERVPRADLRLLPQVALPGAGGRSFWRPRSRLEATRSRMG
jgi:hypothetical protein